MYIPPAFNEPDREILFDFVEQHSFGVLVSQHDGAPFATHLPFLVERNAGLQGSLVGHMARANPHWNQAEGQNALVVFSGPHCYISPAWYEVPDAVPTWNYAAVHVSGIVKIIHDRDELMAIVKRTVALYESPREKPWTFDDRNAYYQKLLQSIVGFRIEITRLDGKWKLNQNRPLEQQAKVARTLEQSSRPDERAIAALMRTNIQAIAPNAGNEP